MRNDAVQFDELRPKLTRVAYQMLGSFADAEDIVHDAYLRWIGNDRSEVQSPEAFLRRIVTRLCLDQLKSARVQREEYIGPWLPEPMVDPEEPEDLTLPLMLALESLSPLERAAFLLHDVFGESFDDIAASLDRDAAACRQLAARARDHVRGQRQRYPIDRENGEHLVQAFFAASKSGDVAGLSAILTQDVRLYSDGGGKRPAASRIMRGLDEVSRTFAAIARLTGKARGELLRLADINGLPGFITREADGMIQTTALLIEDGKIRAVYVVRNPDKLQRLEASLH